MNPNIINLIIVVGCTIACYEITTIVSLLIANLYNISSRSFPWFIAFSFVLLWGICGFGFWSGIKNSTTQPTWQITLISFILCASPQIFLIPIALWVSSFTFAIFNVLFSNRQTATRWLQYFLDTVKIVIPVELFFLCLEYPFLIFFTNRWTIPGALWLINNNLWNVIKTDLYYRITFYFSLLLIGFLVILTFLFLQARKDPQFRDRERIAWGVFLPVLFATPGILGSLFDFRDELLKLSAALAIPLSIFSSIAMTLILGAISEIYERQETFRGMEKTKKDLLKACYVTMYLLLISILPFEISRFSISFAHSQFLYNLLNNANQTVTSFWYWLTNIASIITLWEFARSTLTRTVNNDEAIRYLIFRQAIEELQKGNKNQ